MKKQKSKKLQDQYKSGKGFKKPGSFPEITRRKFVHYSTFALAAAALSLALPGELKRSASLRVGAQDAVLLVLGTIPMFVVAGIIEGFVTPSYIPGVVKIVLGVFVTFLTIAYLALAGQQSMPKMKLQ